MARQLGTLRNAVAGGARRNRNHRRAFRRRFHPRGFGHHPKRIHRLCVECVCHTRPPLIVFCYLWTDERSPFPSYRPGVILILMGLKMIAADYFKVPTLAMLAVVAGVLAVSVLASLLVPVKRAE